MVTTTHMSIVFTIIHAYILYKNILYIPTDLKNPKTFFSYIPIIVNILYSYSSLSLSPD